MTIYLAGAIAGCSDAECKDWRDYAISKLNCKTLNPMDRDYRSVLPEDPSEVVLPDKADIDNSDMLLVVYERPSVGTSMEILYAWERGKKVILVAKEDVVLSPWLSFHSYSRFHTLDEAIDHINNLVEVFS